MDQNKLTEANVSGNETNAKALSKVRAKVIEVTKDKDGKTKTMPEDPFKTLADNNKIVEPPFDLLTLAMLSEHSTELNQCIEAMEVNIETFGHRFQPRLKSTGEKVPKEVQSALEKERVQLENFFAYCTNESFTRFRRKLRRDMESTGCAYFEVIRNAAGKVQQFVHVPSYQMRLGRVHPDLVKVNRKILALRDSGKVEVDSIEEYRRYRSYIQSKNIRKQNLDLIGDNKVVYFKEFGDPRDMDCETGKIGGDVPKEKRANEMVYFNIYSPRTPYGLPRYIGNLLSIFGDRAAEEINFITFRNNNIPSMVVAVSNGQLTEGSVQRIESFVESQIQGSDNYSKFLILEAETLMEGEDGGQMKLDISPLTSQQHKDALFQNYSEKNQDKIRRCFRLPPIFVGRSDEYTHATAESSRRVADEQVFAPERNEFDEFINRIIFPDMGIVYHKFKSNSPNTTDNEQLVKILGYSEKTGGMTPRVSRMIMEDVLGIDLPDFPEGFDPDVPFSLTMAEAVKNKADAVEPGQQVTALKSLAGVNPVIDYLIAVQKQLTNSWELDFEKYGDDGEH